MAATDENVDYLRRRLPAPMLADIAHGARDAAFHLPPTWTTR
jgi:hypothetical protein